MTSFYYLTTAVVFLIYCSTSTFAHRNSTSQEGNTVTACNTNVNGRSNSTICNLKIDKSKIEEVLSLMLVPTINIVEIEVSVVSGNKTRYFQEMTWRWASEIGRTIISLVARAKDSIFTSPIFTSILEVGIEKVDIQVMEETDGCLPPGKKGSDHVFSFLLRQLSRSKDTHFYKLCRRHDNGSLPFNCCRITGGRNLTICADYSSAVIKYAPAGVIVVFFISFFMFLPFVLEHIITYPTNEFYKTSESHMSLFSIVSMIFFEGRGPAKSLFRRCVFAGLSSLVFIPDFCGFLWLQWLFIAWAVLFVIFDDGLMAYVEEEQGSKKPALDEKIISGLTEPFSFLFVDMLKFHSYDKVENGINKCCFYGLIVCSIALVYVFIALPCWIVLALLKFTFADFLLSFVIRKNNLPLNKIWKVLLSYIDNWFECSSNCRSKSECCNLGCSCLKGSLHDLFVGLIALLYLFILLPCWIVLRLAYVPFLLLYHLIVIKECPIMVCKDIVTDCKLLLRLLTFCNLIYFTGMILMFALSIVVGLTLNGEYFNPYIAPILTLIVYFWKNWKFSVEVKCFQLKTSILEVCKEKAETAIVITGTSSGNSTDANSKNINNMTSNNCPADYLCPCMRDTSTEPHTWKSWRSLCSCWTRSTGEFTNGETSSDTPLISETCGGSSIENESSDTNADTSNVESGASPTENQKKLIIEFDQHGEAMISKELYEEISKVILPLDHLLFHFFRRVIFVGLYAFVMFTVMILGQESGVSGSIQVISAIAAALIPFVFYTIFADHHLAQMTSRNMATKERLEQILKVEKHTSNTIFVELININNDESQKNQVKSKNNPNIENV